MKEDTKNQVLLRGVSNEKGGRSLLLSPDEKTAIISFLHMLTDSAFINNPEFSDPDKL